MLIIKIITWYKSSKTVLLMTGNYNNETEVGIMVDNCFSYEAHIIMWSISVLQSRVKKNRIF